MVNNIQCVPKSTHYSDDAFKIYIPNFRAYDKVTSYQSRRSNCSICSGEMLKLFTIESTVNGANYKLIYRLKLSTPADVVSVMREAHIC